MAGTLREPGETIGGYTIVRVLGSGGSGHVYLVRDDQARPAALKLVDARKDPIAAERLGREVRALKKLRHPAVPRILDAEFDDDDTFVVFEFVPGESLADHVAAHGPLEGEELAECAERIASALEAAHRAGVVHRDVTPSNVMLAPEGAVLIDFGLSHQTDDNRLTREGLVSGTAGYVAPEVIDGADPGPIADRWSWAATIAYAMTGDAPFGTGSKAIRRTLEGRVALPEAPGSDALAAALGRDISQRPSMQTVVASLRGATEVFTPVPPTAQMPASVPVREDDVYDDEYDDGYDGYADDADDADDADGGEAVASSSRDGEWEDWYLDDGRSPFKRRPIMIAALTGATICATALAPILAFAVLLLGSVVGRSAYRRAEALRIARARRGERRRDAVLQTVGMPWHLLRAAMELVPSAISAAVIGSGVAALGWWLVSTYRVAPGTMHGQVWGHAVALALGGAAAAAALWWGLWSEGTREGVHRMTAGVAPTRAVAGMWVFVAVVSIAAVVVAVALLAQPWWWPLPQLPR